MSIRRRVVRGQVIDAWQAKGRHYFVFELRADGIETTEPSTSAPITDSDASASLELTGDEGSDVRQADTPPSATSGRSPAALFEMSWEQYEPHSALVITLAADGVHVEVTDLRQPGATRTIPLATEHR